MSEAEHVSQPSDPPPGVMEVGRANGDEHLAAGCNAVACQDDPQASQIAVQESCALQPQGSAGALGVQTNVAEGQFAFGDGNVINKVENVLHQHQHQHKQKVVKNYYSSTTVINANTVVAPNVSTVSTPAVTQDDPNFDIDDDNFVPTKDFDQALAALNAKGCVLVCGPPGSGKTSLGYALLRHYRRQSFRVHITQLRHDWHAVLSEGSQNILLIDGTLGELHVNKKEYNKCQAFLAARKLNKRAECLLVLTAYPHMLQQIGMLDTGSDSPLLESVGVVDLTREPLDTDTMTEMLTRHTQTISLDTLTRTNLVTNILRKKTCKATFPWFCRQMARKWSTEKPVPDPTHIFSLSAEPFASFLQRILCDQRSSQTLAALLALTMLGLGQFLHNTTRAQHDLQRLGFRDIPQSSLEEYAGVLKGNILLDDGGGFYSRDLYDAAGLALGRSCYLPVLLKVCDVRFFVQHVRTEETATEFSISVGSDAANRCLFLERMYTFIAAGFLPEICQHPVFSSRHFLRELETFCNHQKSYLETLLTAVDPVHKMPLLYWAVWSPYTPLLRWCLQFVQRETIARNIFLEAALPAAAACAVYGVLLNESEAKLKMFREVGMEISKGRVSFRLPCLTREQCVSEEMEERYLDIARYLSFLSEHKLYLGHPDLPIPTELLSVRLVEDAVEVLFNGDEWKLMLRLLSDSRLDQTDETGNTMLHFAAKSGNVNAITLAIDSGASLTVQNNNGKTAPQLARERHTDSSPNVTISDLDKACKERDARKVKILLCQGAPAAESIVSPLFSACRANSLQIVNLLVSLGADVNAKNDSGESLLGEACLAGQTDMVEQLLALGARVDSKNSSADTSLHHAAWNGHTGIADMLLRQKANVDASNKHGNTPLFNAASNGHTTTVHRLLESSADVISTNDEGLTPLHAAVTNGHVDIVTVFLECGIGSRLLNARTFSSDAGDTPLLLACRNGATNIVDILLDHHAVVNTKHAHGHTPLHTACRFGHTDVAELLLQKGALVNATNDYGDTPLFYASANGHTNTANMLLNFRAEVNARNRKGSSPLFEACSLGKSETVDLLIKHNADMNAKNNEGQTLMDVAHRRSQKGIVDVLLRHGAVRSKPTSSFFGKSRKQ